LIILQAILASSETREPIPIPSLPHTLAPAPGRVSHGLPQRPNFHPPIPTNDSKSMRGGPRPGFGDNSQTFSDTASIASSGPSHRRGPRNESWYLDYYDRSFNENPWANLEKEKGLGPLGNWSVGNNQS